MKIIGITGILDRAQRDQRLWAHFHRAFGETLPACAFVVEHAYFLPWHGDRIRAYADAIVQKHDTGEDIVLLGYSLGGVIACAIASRFQRSHVRLIVTTCSPHRLAGWWRLGAPKTVPPLITFAAALDWLVPWPLARHPEASEHHIVLTDHLFGFVFSERPARTIARAAARVLTATKA